MVDGVICKRNGSAHYRVGTHRAGITLGTHRAGQGRQGRHNVLVPPAQQARVRKSSVQPGSPSPSINSRTFPSGARLQIAAQLPAPLAANQKRAAGAYASATCARHGDVVSPPVLVRRSSSEERLPSAGFAGWAGLGWLYCKAIARRLLVRVHVGPAVAARRGAAGRLLEANANANANGHVVRGADRPDRGERNVVATTAVDCVCKARRGEATDETRRRRQRNASRVNWKQSKPPRVFVSLASNPHPHPPHSTPSCHFGGSHLLPVRCGALRASPPTCC